MFALNLGSAILLFQSYLGQIRPLQHPEAEARVEVIQPGAFASYWHLVMVAGVICISTGAQTIASHPLPGYRSSGRSSSSPGPRCSCSGPACSTGR
jgi:hypothetical protein